MFLLFCFMERAHSLFNTVCPFLPTYVMDTHIHTGRKDEETGFVFASFQVRVPCGALPALDVWVCKQRHSKMHRNIETNMCMDPCKQINRWVHTHADTQMFILIQTNTHTYMHIFLPTESTSWCWWKKTKHSQFPLQLPLRMWQRLTVFLWTHKDNVSMSSH